MRVIMQAYCDTIAFIMWYARTCVCACVRARVCVCVLLYYNFPSSRILTVVPSPIVSLAYNDCPRGKSLSFGRSAQQGKMYNNETHTYSEERKKNIERETGRGDGWKKGPLTPQSQSPILDIHYLLIS